MPTVTYSNGKTVTLHAANKCGISTVQSYLGYPFWYDMRGRNGKRILKDQGLWIDRDQFKKFTNPKADHKAAVVRDPVSRMRSIYSDRVIKKNRENCKQEITSWDLFVNEFPYWQEKYKDIKIHSILQSRILLSPSSYDKIFTTKQLGDEVRKWLGNIVGVDIPFHKGKDGKGASESIDITPSQTLLIKEYFSDDYKILGNYFL